MSMEEIIKKIIAENGINFLENTDGFITEFEKIAPDMKKEKSILKLALEIGTADYFINVPENIMSIISSISLARDNMKGVLTENLIETIVSSMISAVITDSFKICGADSVMISEGFAESVKKNAEEVKQILSEKKCEYNSDDDFVIGSGVLSKYLGKGGDVVIPDSVKVIGRGAFAGFSQHYSTEDDDDGIEWHENNSCVGLVTVKIPESVEQIESEAFWGCKNLRKITMSRKTKFENNSFSECHPNIKIIYTD